MKKKLNNKNSSQILTLHCKNLAKSCHSEVQISEIPRFALNDTEICTVESPIVQSMKSKTGDSTVIASTNDSECAAIQKNSYRNDWIASSDLRPPRNDRGNKNSSPEGEARWGASRKGKSNCHSELVSESISKKMLKQVQHDKSKKAAFTLAEVLITLGIIGVVAAMTIPTLIANVKGAQNRVQFKKTLSTLNQAVRMNKAKYDWDFADMDRNCGNGILANIVKENPENRMSICAMMNGNLKGHTWDLYWPTTENIEGEKYVPITISALKDSVMKGLLEHSDTYPVTLADGSVFVFNWQPGGCSVHPGEKLTEMKSHDEYEDPQFSYCIGYIDVNGRNLPNKEVECSNGVETVLDPTTPCVVKNSDITDIFPVVFHDSTIEPASNASKYVLNTAK